jgi:glycosyltransferase involved in cell wall biosynthesis
MINLGNRRMRILFLTNFYLVQETGGEDQSCQQVVQGLNKRGHTTLVLTSLHGTDNVPVETNGVYRSLYLEMDLLPWQHSLTFFTQRKVRESHNLRCLERVLEQFAPDIVFIWGMWNLHRSLAALAEAKYPDKVVYRFATYWPTLPSQHELYWRAQGRKWYSKLTKKVLGLVALAMLARENQRPPLTFKHAICVSDTTRRRLVEAGIPVENAQVIYTGIDAQQYLTNQQNHQLGDNRQTLNLLYAGRLVPQKGVDTAIQALEKLVFDQGVRSIRLSVAGSGSVDYQSYLRGLVTEAGLDDYVSFLGHVRPEEMPRLLKQSDILLLPSIWEEPFSRMVLEGMISGLVVVATPRGGTIEILEDGENGLLFAPADPEDLARKITRLIEDPILRRKLANAGQQTVIQRFTMARMMDEIENYLQEVAFPSSDEIGNQLEPKKEGLIMSVPPMLSIIIPTYNRKEPLREILQLLAQQTYPSDRFEVIVVDDGSTDGTPEIIAESFPFALRYVRQSNQGDAAARNFGAQQSQADILVFMDDDMLIEPDYLTCLISAQAIYLNRIVVGTWDLWQTKTTRLSHSSQTLLASGAYYTRYGFTEGSSDSSDQADSVVELPFRDVHSNNMALRREVYFKVGMMQPLEFSGSSMWCDLDFTYRAYRQGFKFLRSTKAVCWHRDRSAETLDGFKKRMRVAAYRSVTLFQKHPELLVHIPMFDDKTPINWRQDPPHLIARKLARAIISSRLTLWSLEQIVNTLEKRYPASSMLPVLYRYIIGGYIFQGYREGLGEFGQVDNKDEPVLLA